MVDIWSALDVDPDYVRASLASLMRNDHQKR
jgi:hypothetical protein